MTEEITMQQGPVCTDKTQLGFIPVDLTGPILLAGMLVRAERIVPLQPWDLPQGVSPGLTNHRAPGVGGTRRRVQANSGRYIQGLPSPTHSPSNRKAHIQGGEAPTALLSQSLWLPCP